MRRGYLFGLMAVSGLLATACADDTDDPTPPPPSSSDGVCHVVASSPSFGERTLSVAGASVTVTFSHPIDAASLAGQVTLSRLDDGSIIPSAVTLGDDHTLTLTPSEELSFFADYGVEIGDGITTSAGEACAGDGLAFSTLSPAETPSALRPSSISSAVLVGSHAIAASSSGRGLDVYSILDPSGPVLLSKTPLDANPDRLVVAGDRLYAAAGYAGVLIFDISNVEAPRLSGVAGTPWTAERVAPFDQGGSHYIAVADGQGSVRIIDVTNPEGAHDVSTLNPSGLSPSQVVSVAVQGSLLAVAEGDGGFSLVDVSNVASPSVISHRLTQATAETFDQSPATNDVAFEGTHLYVSMRHNGLESFDITDPTNPTFVSMVLGPQGMCSTGCPDVLDNLTVANGFLYATSAMTGAIRIPTSATGALASPDVFVVSGRVGAVAVDASSMFVGAEPGFTVFGASASPSDAPTYIESNGWGVERGVDVVGSHAYVSSSSVGLEAYDLSNRLAPSRTARVATAGVEADFGLVGVDAGPEGLFVSDARAGFSVFGLSDPTTPNLVSSVSGADGITGILLDSGRAYMCDGNHALRIYDVADPSNLQLVGSLLVDSTVGGCSDLVKSGDSVFIAGGKALGVLDVSDPTHPSLASVVPLPADDVIGALALDGTTLYATSNAFDWEGENNIDRRLYVFDIADPTNPLRLYKSPDLGGAGHVVLRGTKAFVAAGGHGVLIFDVRDPSQPILEGSIATSGSAADLSFSGDTLYVARLGGGLGAVDIGRTE